MLRSARRSRCVVVAFMFVILIGSGCSDVKTAPEEIEGKTPAEYREEAERGIVDSVPAAPKASKSKR